MPIFKNGDRVIKSSTGERGKVVGNPSPIRMNWGPVKEGQDIGSLPEQIIYSYQIELDRTGELVNVQESDLTSAT